MREIIEILMRRDGISWLEAANIVEECQNEISEAMADNASYDDIADIIANVLGLEPDYMDCFMM